MKNQISIALALLMMVSSIGMAKSTHICMGSEMMTEFGLTTKHLNCGMDCEHSDMSFQSHQSIDPLDCCQNQFELVQNDIDQNIKVLKIDTAQLIFIAAFIHSFIIDIASSSISEHPYTFPPPPPPLEKDFTILFQSFLI